MSTELDNRKKKEYLAKSKSMVRAVIRAKTTKLGTKLSYYAAYKTVNSFHNDGDVPEVCSFKVSDFIDNMKISKSAVYRKIKKNNMITNALRSEMNKVLTFQFSIPKNPDVLSNKIYDENDYETYNIFTKTWTDEGNCYFEVNKKVFKEHFLQLQEGEFVTTPLKLVSSIKNDYTIRFYDYFKSYLWNFNFIYKKAWELPKLKVLLGAELAKSYNSNVGSLKQKILDPVVKEINENTDIFLDYRFRKNNNNKITHIVFVAKLKNSFTKNTTSSNEINEEKIMFDDKILKIEMQKILEEIDNF